MLPIPTKIRAVAEDPSAPLLDCYPGTTATELARLFASRTSKKETQMYVQIPFETLPAKRHIPGIRAAGDRAHLVRVLSGLGLIASDDVPRLEALAEHNFVFDVQVSVYELDQKLKHSDASTLDKIGFKRSLERAGLLKV